MLLLIVLMHMEYLLFIFKEKYTNKKKNKHKSLLAALPVLIFMSFASDFTKKALLILCIVVKF